MRYLTFVFRLIIATTQTSTLLALLGLVGLAQSTLAGEFQVVDKHGTPPCTATSRGADSAALFNL